MLLLYIVNNTFYFDFQGRIVLNYRKIIKNPIFFYLQCTCYFSIYLMPIAYGWVSSGMSSGAYPAIWEFWFSLFLSFYLPFLFMVKSFGNDQLVSAIWYKACLFPCLLWAPLPP